MSEALGVTVRMATVPTAVAEIAGGAGVPGAVVGVDAAGAVDATVAAVDATGAAVVRAAAGLGTRRAPAFLRFRDEIKQKATTCVVAFAFSAVVRQLLL
jgi:hypothetical protein